MEVVKAGQFKFNCETKTQVRNAISTLKMIGFRDKLISIEPKIIKTHNPD